MAPKRSSHLNDPPAASSFEEASSEEEDEGASQTKNPPKKPDSSSGSDSDAESRSDSDPADSAAKPIAPKPSPAPAKRRPGETEAKDPKRAKKKAPEPEPEPEPEDESKKLFQRVWSEEDEIVILKGMIDYVAKKGLDPSGDMNAFHDFIKKSLQIDCSKTQLADKVRRLKKKFENNWEKKKKNKYNPTKPHEEKMFELSNKIWGGASAKSEQPKATGPASKALAAWSQALEMDWCVGVDKSLGVLGVVKRGLGLISEPKKAEFEAKWRNIQAAEMELFVKRTQLMSDQAKEILKSLKSA